LDKVKFKFVDGAESKTDIDPKEIKNWRWTELRISFSSIVIFGINLFELSDFHWNSVFFFFTKLNLFYILCTKRDFISTSELHPERASLTAALFGVLWFPVSHLSNPHTIKYYINTRSNYARTDYS